VKEISHFYSYYLISGSVDLKDLESGQHSVTIFGRYARQSMPDEIGVAMQTVHFTIDNGKSQIISNTDTINIGHDRELPINTVYAFAGIFSIVVVVSFALFAKRKPKID